MSKKVRQLVDLGPIMLAIEKYKKSEASIEKAARIAGVSISEMMDVLSEYGVDANVEYEDYLKGSRGSKRSGSNLKGIDLGKGHGSAQDAEHAKRR